MKDNHSNKSGNDIKPGFKILTLILILFISDFQNNLFAFPPNNLPKPTPLQMEWQKLETITFVHFSVNTFTDQEWGYGNESPEIFNPTELDCRQWAMICKDAGLKGIIFTAKHHDGFCLWPSEFTEHSVKNSPWRNGKGDIVRELSDACNEFGLKFGLYLSPWDCNHAEYGKAGYNTYFKNQLTELLSNYGEIFEIWFDGANGGRGYYGTDSLHVRKIPDGYYDWEGIENIVHQLQPDCVIHGGPINDIRWVGNEEGHAGETHWSTLFPWKEFKKNINPRLQLNEGHEDGPLWLPSETDVSLRSGWYYHASEDHKVKSLPRLIDIYYQSVGRNSLLLLNFSPDKRGLIHPIDSARVLEWRRQLDKDFKENLINSSQRFNASNKENAGNAFDNDDETYWQASLKSGFLEIDFKQELVFNRLLLQEYIQDGQKVKSFAVDYWDGHQWQEFEKQTTIGYKRILRFPSIKTSKLKIRIEDALAPPMICNIAIYNAPVLPIEPEIRRNQQGMVKIISPDKNGQIFYTLDGSEPTSHSHLYQDRFFADGKRTVKALTIGQDGSKSELAVVHFSYSKKEWKIVGEGGETPFLFDGDPQTAWFSNGKKEVVIDFDERIDFSGLVYLPDQSKSPKGIPLDYEILISNDKESWKLVSQGEFANIQNNPNIQKVNFKESVTVRYLKFKVHSIINNQEQLGIATLEIIN